MTYLNWLRQRAQDFEERASDERGETAALYEARMNAYRDAALEYVSRNGADE